MFKNKQIKFYLLQLVTYKQNFIYARKCPGETAGVHGPLLNAFDKNTLLNIKIKNHSYLILYMQ